MNVNLEWVNLLLTAFGLTVGTARTEHTREGCNAERADSSNGGKWNLKERPGGGGAGICQLKGLLNAARRPDAGKTARRHPNFGKKGCVSLQRQNEQKEKENSQLVEELGQIKKENENLKSTSEQQMKEMERLKVCGPDKNVNICLTDQTATHEEQ